MKTLAGLLISLATLMLWSGSVLAAGQIFVVEGEAQKDGAVIVNKVTQENGEPSIDIPATNGYTLVIVSDFGHELYRGHLPANFTYHLDPLPEEFTLAKIPFRIRLPFFLSAKTLSFVKDGQTVLAVDLPKEICPQNIKDGVCTEFCQGRGLDPDCFQCGNGFCDPNESLASCPLDCHTAAAAAAPAGEATKGGLGVLGWLGLGALIFGAAGLLFAFGRSIFRR